MTKTINGLTVTTSAASGDFIPIWRAANSDTRKITKANLIGAALTGGGTIATGGFTLTVPATGTAALLGTAQTFSALQTFTSGISFGAETLSVYDEGTWTPTDSSGATLTFQSAAGRYIRIGNAVFFDFHVRYPVTADNSPAMIGGLPFTVSTLNDTSGGGGWIAFSAIATLFRMQVLTSETISFSAGSSAVQNSTFSNGTVRGGGFYIVG